jgi:hypothetical protein
MKKISMLFILSLAFLCSFSQGTKVAINTKTATTATQAIKLTTYNAKYITNAYGTITNSEIGTPATTISQPELKTGATVYWRITVANFKAIKAKYRLDLHVMQVKDGKEELSYKHDLFIPTQNGWADMFSEFGEGTYNIYIRDQDNPEDVYSKATFTVLPKPKIDYKHNSTLQVCQTVDDNWNAVGATKTIKAGECVNFLFKAKDKVAYSVMAWNVTKVNAEGNEDYVTVLDQGTQGKPFRYLATEGGVCVFTTPGKYRIYLFEKDKIDTQIKRTEESSAYLGMTEITVQ